MGNSVAAWKVAYCMLNLAVLSQPSPFIAVRRASHAFLVTCVTCVSHDLCHMRFSRNVLHSFLRLDSWSFVVQSGILRSCLCYQLLHSVQPSSACQERWEYPDCRILCCYCMQGDHTVISPYTIRYNSTFKFMYLNWNSHRELYGQGSKVIDSIMTEVSGQRGLAITSLPVTHGVSVGRGGGEMACVSYCPVHFFYVNSCICTASSALCTRLVLNFVFALKLAVSLSGAVYTHFHTRLGGPSTRGWESNFSHLYHELICTCSWIMNISEHNITHVYLTPH
jgi:hypothetical protein